MPQTDCRHGRLDVLHCIVDGEACGYAAAGRIDVEIDRFLRVLGFEEEELGDDRGGQRFFYLAIKANDTFFEESAENVGCARSMSVLEVSRGCMSCRVHVWYPPPLSDQLKFFSVVVSVSAYHCFCHERHRQGRAGWLLGSRIVRWREGRYARKGSDTSS